MNILYICTFRIRNGWHFTVIHIFPMGLLPDRKYINFSFNFKTQYLTSNCDTYRTSRPIQYIPPPENIQKNYPAS